MAYYSPLNSTLQFDAKTKIDKKVDYSNLPCPVPYDEIHCEATMSLSLDLFEGFRFDYNKFMNQKFFLTHSIWMGPTEVPAGPPHIIKIPASNYAFGAAFIDPKLMLMGRIMTDGKLNANVKWHLTDNFSINANSLLTNEQDMSCGTFNFDYNHVTPHLSLGGDVFRSGQHLKSGVGFAARYETDKMVASAQVASNGMAIMNYVQKVSLATAFMYNYMSREITASVGYDYILRLCRLRGKIDSNGVVAACLEEHMSAGFRFLLSAEVDHVKKDYKFGFGINVS